MSAWLVPRDEMTVEQLRAIELSPREHRVIFGAPGSGKTQVLLHRAKYLCDHSNTPPDGFRIFVYTNVLKNYIRSALDLLDLPESSVVGIYKWYMDFHQREIGRAPWNAAARQPDFDAIQTNVLQKIRSMGASAKMYDFVMVDEAQDLQPEAFEILCAIADHVTVCLDNKQQIFDRRASEAQILSALGLRRRNAALLGAFRCCPYIVNLSAEFIRDSEEKQAYLQQARVPQTEITTPLLYYASDFDDEFNRLREAVRARLLKGDKVAVLLPHNRQIHGFARGLNNAGISVEVPNDLDFSSGRPKLLTYHGAKGLTFDAVLLPRLVRKSFEDTPDELIERLLFVGISRATKWVMMSAVNRSHLPLLDRLRDLESTGQLQIQVSSGQETVPETEDKTDPDEDDGLFDLL